MDQELDDNNRPHEEPDRSEETCPESEQREEAFVITINAM